MYDVIHDPEKDVYALVDPEAGRALGPLLTGPQAADVLHGFVGALGVDPSTVPPWSLESKFEQFIGAISAGEPAAGDAAGAGEPVVPTSEPPAGRGAATPPPGTPEGAPSDEPPAPAPADADPGAGEPTRATVQAGNKPCPSCDGYGTIAQGGEITTCPTCNGTGQVSEHDVAPTSDPTAPAADAPAPAASTDTPPAAGIEGEPVKPTEEPAGGAAG